MKPRTRHDLAQLATAAELEADRLHRRVLAARGLALYVAVDELEAFADRLAECVAVIKEYHSLIAERKSA